MRKLIGLIGFIGMMMVCSINAKAEEFQHTRVEDFVEYDVVTDSFHPLIGYDTEEQINEEIEEGEIEMLAQLVEAEARNQDYHGKCLVADVVLNRVHDSKFPDTLEDVIFQILIDKDGKKHYQFATIQDGAFDKAGWNISEKSFQAAYEEYYADRRRDDCILYFTAGSYNPWCIPAYKYGDHYFGY